MVTLSTPLSHNSLCSPELSTKCHGCPLHQPMYLSESAVLLLVWPLLFFLSLFLKLLPNSFSFFPLFECLEYGFKLESNSHYVGKSQLSVMSSVQVMFWGLCC